MYTYEVTENIATAGMGTTSLMKYRWVIKRDGAIIKAGYSFTMPMADKVAAATMAKLEAKGGTWFERFAAKVVAKRAARG